MAKRGERGLKLLKIGLLTAIFLLVIDLGLLFYSGFFSIKSIQVNEHNLDCLNGVSVQKESALLNKKIFFVDQAQLEKLLKSKYSCIKTVKLIKKYPQSALIEVYGRRATLNLVSSLTATPSSFLVDEEGVIFATNGGGHDIPKLYLSSENLKIGDKISENILKNAYLMLQDMKKMGIFSKEAIIYSSSILEVDSMPKIIIDLSKNFNKKLVSLQLITTQAKIEERQLDLIDLRFENPVVKYAPKNGKR